MDGLVLNYFLQQIEQEGLERSYLKVNDFYSFSNENTSLIGLLSSSAKNDPILILFSNSGVSNCSKP